MLFTSSNYRLYQYDKVKLNNLVKCLACGEAVIVMSVQSFLLVPETLFSDSSASSLMIYRGAEDISQPFPTAGIRLGISMIR